MIVRVFTSGAVELRTDAEQLGAAAYTAENVPPRFAGRAWSIESRPDPLPPERNPAALLAGRTGGQRLTGGTLPQDRLELKGTAADEVSEVTALDPLRLVGDGKKVVIVLSEFDSGGAGPSVGRLPVLDERSGLVRYLKLWAG